VGRGERGLLRLAKVIFPSRDEPIPATRVIFDGAVAFKVDGESKPLLGSPRSLAVNLRNKHKAGFEQRHGARLTFMPFFVRAAVMALQQWPILNASIEGDNIRYHRQINLGIAVALDWGLIVPVVKNAGDLNFLGLQRGISDLGERARTKKLKPEDVEGSTFTITNPGQFGAVFGLPIINQPNSAIMGVGGITKQPMVITDKDGTDSIAIRSVVHLTLGYDHRLIDGAVADQFMAQVKKNLETWSEEVG